MAIRNSFNFREVSYQLTTSGVVGGNRLKGLAEEGYSLVINLLPDDNEHAVPDEKSIVEAQGVEYIYIPVDFFKPTQQEFEQFSSVLDRAQNQKVHIHCAANYRVSGFYARYAMERGLWTKAEANAFVTELWNPDKFPCWIAFMRAAEEINYKI